MCKLTIHSDCHSVNVSRVGGEADDRAPVALRDVTSRCRRRRSGARLKQKAHDLPLHFSLMCQHAAPNNRRFLSAKLVPITFFDEEIFQRCAELLIYRVKAKTEYCGKRSIAREQNALPGR